MILKNCRLVPELSEPHGYSAADIEINQGKIVSIAETQPERACSEEIIDCQGHTLLPGLFDLHAHLSIASAEETPDTAMRRLIQTIPRLSAYTDLGVTSIRDCGSCLRLTLPLRDAIAENILEGPMIQAAGYMLGPREMEKMGREMTMTMSIADNESGFYHAACYEREKGADFIKIYASSSASRMAAQSSHSGLRAIMTREEIGAVVKAAEERGTYVAAHAHALEAIKSCIEEGVRTIEHGTFIDDETIELLLKKDGSYLVPTLSVLVDEEVPDEREYSSELREAAERIGRAYRAGCKMGFGTDLYNGELSRFPQEFRIRKELCGMRDLDILLQATKYSAEIIGAAEQTGTVKAGLRADLILVDGNPDQDISVMYKKPLMVFQNGERQR